MSAPLNSASARTSSSSGRAGALLLLQIALALVIVQLSSDWLIDSKVELVAKLLLLAAMMAWFSKWKLGMYGKPAILCLSIIIIIQAGLTLDSKSLARTVITCMVLLSFFERYAKRVYAVLIVILFLAIYDYVNSRALLVTLIVGAALILLGRLDRRLISLKVAPIMLTISVVVVGWLFTFDSMPYIEQSSSNIARSTIVFSLLYGLQDFPFFGYPTLSAYDSHLVVYGRHLYEADYRDPHNFFISSLAWGGGTLFLVVYISYCKLIASLESANRTPTFYFLIAAFFVFLTTATLSMVNFIFICFLMVSLCERK